MSLHIEPDSETKWNVFLNYLFYIYLNIYLKLQGEDIEDNRVLSDWRNCSRANSRSCSVFSLIDLLIPNPQRTNTNIKRATTNAWNAQNSLLKGEKISLFCNLSISYDYIFYIFRCLFDIISMAIVICQRFSFLSQWIMDAITGVCRMGRVLLGRSSSLLVLRTGRGHDEDFSRLISVLKVHFNK